jgi:hypothetical protein
LFAASARHDVVHQRNASLDHGLHGGRIVLPALDFHRVGMALLGEPDAGGDSLLLGELVASEGEVGNDEGVFG